MIVCLGWGSLIWRNGDLEMTGGWKENGPKVSVEYLRQSKKGQLTLVIDHDAPLSTALWAQMQAEDLNKAKENLQKREGTIPKFIESWSKGEPDPKGIFELSKWAEENGVSAVVWTALPAKFKGENGVKPSMEEAVAYIENLEDSGRKLAEEYIRKTPPQIRTPFRKEFEERFSVGIDPL